jgi:hypothetical protein
MEDDGMTDVPEVSEEVFDTLRQAALFLEGKGDPPDYDALTDEVRDLVYELLPAVVELVADRIAPIDDETSERPATDESTVLVVGQRLRAAREGAGMSVHELAVGVSARGRTIGATNVEALEAALETPVDPVLAAALGDVLGVDSLGPQPGDVEQAILQDIRWAHPDADVRRDPLLVDTAVDPLVRLVVSDFGLVVRLAVFDTRDEAALGAEPQLAVAREIAAVDRGETEWFLLVAGADPERVTQVVHVRELRATLRAPGGTRATGPQRHPVVLADAIRYVFEDVAGAEWEDVGTSAASGPLALDLEEAARLCAAAGIAEATKTKARSPARSEGLASIADPETTTLQRLLVGVTHRLISPGEEFRSSFEGDLVGTA